MRQAEKEREKHRAGKRNERSRGTASSWDAQLQEAP